MATVSVFSTAIALLALNNDGLTSTDVELNDAGIWVTRTQDNLLGRFNTAAKVVDGAVTAGSSSFDVLQQGDTVLLHDDGAGSLSPVDPAALELRGTAGLPKGAQVGLGDGSVAILDATAGLLWVLPADQAGGFSADGTEPAATGLEDGALAVGVDGTVYVAAAGALTTVETDHGQVTGTETRPLADAKASDVLAVTAVGEHPVVLDRTTGTAYLSGDHRATVGAADLVALQQPGQDSDAVVLADATRLLSLPLDGSAPRALGSDGNGTPVPPVYLNGCAYGAWTGSGQVARDCSGTGDDLVRNLGTGVGGKGARLVYRVNRDIVVLNEMTAGSVWLADKNYELFDDWKDVLPDKDDQEDKPDPTPDKARDIMLDRDKPNRPPVAADDDLGVRPGRTTILRVLDNDADPDGDALTVSLDEPGTPLGTVQPIYGDAAVQIAVPEDADGATTFPYVAHDGRGKDDTARVRVRVHGWDVNAAPKRVRDKALPVELGQSVQARVLDDWIDPDGDDLLLTGATIATKGDEVRFRPDGTLTYQDAGLTPGRKAVTITVSDGQAETEGTVWIDVKPAGQQPPVARIDHATTVVGRPVTITPLVNDTDANGDQLRLARVDEAAPARLTTDFDAGTVQLVSDVARVYYLTYLVTDGPSSTLGLIRVDVTDPPSGDGAPVAVKDTALLPADGTVLVDVVGNDVDPAGGVLVLQSVDARASDGVTAEIVEHHLLRLSAVRNLEGPVTLHYTVSNGLASAVGEVLVMPVPAPAVLRPPRAADDEAVVRAGDIVTIPVLDNDTHPDDATLQLRPALVEKPDTADGLAFTAKDTVRFHAGPNAKTVHAVYEIVDPQGQVDSAQITIHIRAMDAAHNSPPRPQDLEARVLAGSTVRIIVPTNGVDPDGDRVALMGLETAPTKGRVLAVGAGWIDYQANASSTGVDRFDYRVQDALGARATGTVTIGIAPGTEGNLEPVAVDDITYVRPGRTVAVPVLVNDVDPEGDRVRLVTGGLELPKGVTARIELDRVVVETPVKPGAYTIYYTIADSFGAKGVGALTVDVSGDAPLRRPVAQDDAFGIAQVVGRTTVDVPVLDNDDDPDGFAKDLEVSLPEGSAKGPDGLPTASVSPDKSVKVTLTAVAQIIPYTVTDQDKKTASAFILVPGLGHLPPALRPDIAELTVVSGKTLPIDLADYVLVADGRDLRLTEAGKVTAVRGTGTAVDPTHVSYVSEAGYVGAAAISFEVADGAQQDKTTQTAVLTIPIKVLAPPRTNAPPVLTGATMSVEAGTTGTLDLAPYAKDPNPDDTLTFAMDGRPAGAVQARLAGSVLTVTAPKDVPKGTKVRVQVTVSDGTAKPVTGSVQVTVVGSTRPLATANLDVLADAHQGVAVDIPVLANDANPFPETPLTLLDVAVDTGAGTASVHGSSVTVTPAATFVGTMTLHYSVSDATKDSDRIVDGRIELTVIGAPGPLTAPTVVEVRSETIVLSWSPPVNNGAPITGYTVTSQNGYTRECPTTTCTLTGLTNDTEYTFTVVAHNKAGDSPPSPASATARPDERPDAPDAPVLAFGDKALTVSWTNTSYSDRSAITSVTLEISPAPPSGIVQKTGVVGTSLVWDGLENGTEYRVRVQAVNRAPEPSDFSAYSAGEVPAGVPDAPPAPTSSRIDTPLGGEIDVRWSAPAANGDAIGAYELTVLRDGSVERTIGGIPGTQQSVTGLDVSASYTFTVRASNKAGFSAMSAPSAAVVPYGKPGPAGTPTAALIPGDTSGKARVTFAPAVANGNPVSYTIRANGNVVVNATTQTTVDVGGLSNGQSYTFTVEPTNAGGSGGQTAASNAVVPYGTPPTPNAGANGGNQNVAVSWSSGGTNGRPVQIQISIDGGGWQDVADSGSRNISSGYSETHQIRVRAQDSTGQNSGVAQASATSDPAPPPPVQRLWISKGASAVGQSGCATSGCAYLVFNTENYTGPTSVRIICEENLGVWSTFGNSSGFIYNLPANGSVRLQCYYGRTGKQVRGTITSTNPDTSSDPLTW